MVRGIETSWGRCMMGTWRISVQLFIHLSPRQPLALCLPHPALLSQTQLLPIPLSCLISFTALITILNHISHSLVIHSSFTYCLCPHQTVNSMRSGDVSACTLQNRGWHVAGIKIAEAKNEPIHWTPFTKCPMSKLKRFQDDELLTVLLWSLLCALNELKSFECNE